MGLLGNNAANLFGCGRRWMGASTSVTSFPGGRGNQGNFRRWIMQSGATTALPKAAKGTGYYPPTTYEAPITVGELGATMRLAGVGAITPPSLAGGLAAGAALTGDGNISNAALSLIVSAIAALTGGGDLTATLNALANAAAALSASGDITAADLRAIAILIAALSGAGDVTGTATALGSLEADITVAGDLLTTANVADAVWGAICEDTLTYEDVMRILLAVQAGVSTIVDLGGGSATVTFRNVADTKARVTADMVDSERVTVTLDPTD